MGYAIIRKLNGKISVCSNRRLYKSRKMADKRAEELSKKSKATFYVVSVSKK